MNCDGFVYEYGLLKEARKSWDYFISDEIVHLMESTRRDREVCKEIAKGYVKGALWIEVHILFHGKRNTDNMAIVGIIESYFSAKSLRIWELNSQGSAVNGNVAMLAGLADSIQLPEQSVSVGIPSIVRLKRFDNLDRLRIDMLNGISEVLPPAIIPVAENRKLGFPMKTFLDIILTNDSALVTCEPVNGGIKFLKVYLRPINLSFCAFELVDGRY